MAAGSFFSATDRIAPSYFPHGGRGDERQRGGRRTDFNAEDAKGPRPQRGCCAWQREALTDRERGQSQAPHDLTHSAPLRPLRLAFER